ncbi:DUF4238 domain-containing protein [Mesorhizobium sp. CA14]|uniref:DUF4238 domain-containing protein n=1 Tax=Mesorhizobium sp. CA14 TaxID=2876642 RepID=UPI001CCFA6FD|nr:DUF4238 domain-containing protein [Mesorhizobium sp. CA14]MBZ9851363.1 DUF4238 domain-containing protein [Mesorhizobium sp. CA14]
MSVPKRHHYVPQMLLNGFTDSEGWLHWCRPSDRPVTVRRARPPELFHQNHLYSTLSDTGTKDPAMEHALSILESEAAGVVQSILLPARAGKLPALTHEQKLLWYTFFLTQWRRTPETQRANVSDAEALRMIEETLDELRQVAPHRANEIEALATPEAKARTMRNVRVQTIGQQPSVELMRVLQRRGIAILRIAQPNKRFIIGSRPVVKLTTQNSTDLNDLTVEMWLPLASDVAVGVGQGDGNVSLHHTVDERPVRQLNIAIARQSGTIAAASGALVKSIADTR